jgi:hypothetical protein
MQTTTMPMSRSPETVETEASAVSWAAIIGGAFVIAAVTILLLALGSGLSLSSVSPWPGSGVSATTFTVMTAIWLIVVQWLSAALGGYVTGRLRTRWTGVHSHEVFFRDTAHGLLAWAVASVIGIGLLASGASAIVGGGARATGNLAATVANQGAAQSGGTGGSLNGYYVDQLFRSNQEPASGQDPRAEVMRILAAGAQNGSISDGDKTYLAQLVAARTGISQDDAQKRVDNLISQEQAAEQKAKAAADQARKAAASLSFYTFFSMLIGAFIASAAAALGGRSRDEY